MEPENKELDNLSAQKSNPEHEFHEEISEPDFQEIDAYVNADFGIEENKSEDYRAQLAGILDSKSKKADLQQVEMDEPVIQKSEVEDSKHSENDQEIFEKNQFKNNTNNEHELLSHLNIDTFGTGDWQTDVHPISQNNLDGNDRQYMSNQEEDEHKEERVIPPNFTHMLYGKDGEEIGKHT